jgi:hypothetical protein
MPKMMKMRPQLISVPGFWGIFIHEGNTVKDTRGCILLGENTSKGFVSHSKQHVIALTEEIQDCEDRQDRGNRRGSGPDEGRGGPRKCSAGKSRI